MGNAVKIGTDSMEVARMPEEHQALSALAWIRAQAKALDASLSEEAHVSDCARIIAHAISPWVSVKTELPKKHEHVLLRGILHGQYVEGMIVHHEGCLCGNGTEWADWCGDIDEGVEVTHWKPLPPKP